MIVTEVRNVNEALAGLQELVRLGEWRTISPRGNTTIELRSPHTTVYLKPSERVLFDQVRDANPFFHLMEALWIMAGRCDVKFLAKFNSQMEQFSDDKKVFHAPYGFRLRRWISGNEFGGEPFFDQVVAVVEMLRKDPDTRRAVMSIWNPVLDLGTSSKDIPCNDLITFKLRENTLDISVMCRSNDAILGAYGANAVQFSFLQEFIALAVGAKVGAYRQISDSFHIYTEQEVWKRLQASPPAFDPYKDAAVTSYPIISGTPFTEWLVQCELFCDRKLDTYRGKIDPFFIDVAAPVMDAWHCYKEDTSGLGIDKNTRIEAAINILYTKCAAEDWGLACKQWLQRRIQV